MFWKRKKKPVLLFDGECDLCKRWVGNWKELTKDAVDYQPYQKACRKYPQIQPEDCGKEIHLVMPNGKVYAGAHAVFKALYEGKSWRGLLFFYDHFPPFAKISEAIYKAVSNNRDKLNGKKGGCNCGKS